MISIAVRCDGDIDDAWSCSVVLREHGIDISTHRVHVRAEDLARLAPGASDPTLLVEASFEFLLDHESPQMILRAFDLAEINRYFPAYEPTIHGRSGHVSSGSDV